MLGLDQSPNMFEDFTSMIVILVFNFNAFGLHSVAEQVFVINSRQRCSLQRFVVLISSMA